ncbi:MAG: hydrogen gas-evolving membrane-bound hydrogenase subunit E [Pseudomonadota bacterium]
MGVASGSPDRAGAVLGWALALAAALACAGFAQLVPSVAAGTAHEMVLPWAERLGVSLAFRLDGLSQVFALLITGFGAVIAVYAGSYLKGHRHLGRFFLYLGLFMIGMLGLVLADDLILMFVFWEVTTVASFLLIGFDHAKPEARRSAWQSLLITGAGGLALLAGLVLLGIAAGTTRISEILAIEGLTAHPLYPAILALVLLGAFTKSAQIPFHIWLPNAMAAPTPVSAYLHSATMVKAGVYLLARLHPALSGTEAWMWSLSLAGGVTMVMAAVLALRQSDLKLALAYTSVMALGSLVMFLGAEATIAIAAAFTFLIVHALYKAALFLTVGSIDHATGTREIARLGGLWRTMPMTAMAGVLAAGSMAGFPPFLGFIGKELKYEGALAIAEEPILLAAAAVLANALMVTLALSILFRVILGRKKPVGPDGPPRAPHESPVALWLGPLALASLGLVFGIAPDLVGATLVQPAVTAVTGAPQVVKLKLWHGVNVPLMMSFATVGIGLLGYIFHGALMRTLQRMPAVADRSWDALLGAIATSFSAISRAVQPGSLRIYLGVSFVVMAVLPLMALVGSGGLSLTMSDELDPVVVGAALLAIAGAILAAAAERRMAALGGLGAVGAGVAMLFVLYGAPDVAITQLMVDVMLIVLVASVMVRLPELRAIGQGRGINAAIAGLMGVAVAALTLAIAPGAVDSAVSADMAAASVPEAKGRNIVNVILVDFRALDTFGEIVVVAAAAIGALALIRMKPRRSPQGARP